MNKPMGSAVSDSDLSVRGSIQHELFYRFGEIVLPLAASLSAVTGLVVVLTYERPASWVLGVASFVLAAIYFVFWKVCLPLVENRRQLDALAFICFFLTFSVQAFGFYAYGHQNGFLYGSLALLGAVTFSSTRLYAANLAAAWAIWFVACLLRGHQLPANEIVHTCLMTPVIAAIARFAYMRCRQELDASQARQTRSLTELVESQERLRDAEQLRISKERQLHDYHAQKMESLGVLARGIAHDFNNYLLAIVAVAESIQAEHHEDETAEHAKQIEAAALSAAAVCKEMLTFTGKSQLVKEYIDPNSLLNELEPLIKAAMPKNVRLVFKPTEESVAVLVDASQIKQAILNLVTNASEATQPEGGTVQVSCTPFTADKDSSLEDFLVVGDRLGPGEYIAFSVSDDGVGMSPETQSQAFDPYFTTKTDGHGFGLSVTAGIVKGHGGAIRCRSSPPTGTTMTLVFPRVRRPISSVEPTQTNAMDALGSILVVDDEPIVLDSVSKMLSSVGWSVSKAEDGAQAIKLLRDRAQEFIAVVLDYSMPGMNGLEAVKQMREEGLNTPVVLCSGFMEPTDEDGQAVSPNAFIKKPYRMETLQSAIATALIGENTGAFREEGE